MADKYTDLFKDAGPPVPGNTPDKYEGLFDSVATPSDKKASTNGQFRGATRVPKMFGHALATGVQTMLGLPGTISKSIDSLSGVDEFKPRNKLEAGLKAVGNAISLPTIEGISKFTGLGLENHPELKPESAFERYGSAIISALPAVPLGMAGGVGVGSALLTTGAGAVAAQAAADLAPGNKWLPAVAGFFGSLTAGGLLNAAEKTIATNKAWTRLATAEKGLDDALDASFALKDPTARVVEKTSKAANALELAQDSAFVGKEQAAKAALRVEKAASANLAAQEKAANELVNAVDSQVIKTFDEIATSLGQSKTLQEVGGRLQEAARSWKEKIFPKQIEDVAKPLASAIPDDTPTDLAGFSKALGQITSSGGKLNPLIAELTPKLPARLKSVLEAGDEVAELAGTPTVYTWGEVRELRSALGDALGNPKIVNDIGEQNLRHLYSVVTGDLRAVAKQANAAELFDEYNKVSTELYNLAGGPISRLINSTNKALETVKPEKIAAELISEGKLGATDLAALRSAIPEAMDDLGAVVLRRGGFDELAPEAKAVLFGDKTAVLDAAAAQRVQASTNAKVLIEKARAETEAMRLAAKEAALTGKFDQMKILREAQKAKRAEDAANHAAAVERGRALAKQSYEASKAVRDARKELKSAKADVPEPEKPLDKIANRISRATSGGAAYLFAEPVMNALSLPMGAGTQAAFGAAGLLLPPTWSMGKEFVRNPRSALVPAAGALTGINALAPGTAVDRTKEAPNQ